MNEQQIAMILIGEKLRLIQQLLQECEELAKSNHLNFVVTHENLNRFSDSPYHSPLDKLLDIG